MRPIIRVHNLSKQYRIGRRRTHYQTLRESVMELASAPFRRLRRRPEPASDSIWALRDVSFEVKPGEAIGIIGRNGAGKSTLLKILARIVEPTLGCAELYGRVGSLLEVGTGFHPELTGRENVYLNGAILGMSRWEIGRKFDEIVEFAEVEKFIDTAVKYFSSGMYMRLAFAVAAHLQPEILLVDEVLAVGDAAFQKKCLGKMGAIARQGRTVFFVSHNTTAVKNLCTHALLLQQGQLVHQGSPKDCLMRYLAEFDQLTRTEVDLRQARRPLRVDESFQVEGLRLVSRSGYPRLTLAEPITVELTFSVSRPLEDVALGVSISSSEFGMLVECRSNHCYGVIPHLAPGRYRVSCTIEPNPLNRGVYTINAGARCARKHLDFVPEAMSFEVESGDAPTCTWLDDVGGCLRMHSSWTPPEPSASESAAAPQSVRDGQSNSSIRRA
jgi:lipopolysaccharide transport system ATP-binding protein